MIVPGTAFEVEQSWKSMPMWGCDVKGDPVGYVKANTLEEAYEKAIEKFGPFVRAVPWDGIL